MEALKNGAQTYCKFRITAGAIIGLACALSMCVLAAFLPRWMGSTSNYLEVSGVVKSGTVIPLQGSTPQFKAQYIVEYTVSGVPYTSVYDNPNAYPTQAQTELVISNAIGKPQILYYDPSNPSKTASVKNIEKWISVGLSSLASLMATSAAVSYMFRDNPIFCGLTIASNAASVLRSQY